MTTIADALRLARRRIEAVDARALLQHVSGLSHAQLVARPETELDARARRKFEDLVARRAAGEPIAYLVGWREFYGRRFVVTADVLIPRPETELLVELAIQTTDRRPAARILDLGTGCGALAITLQQELPDTALTATDTSSAALQVASHNAAVLGASVRCVESDWYAALRGERYDMIVANPPYVAPDDPHLDQGDLRFEPRSALAGRGPAGTGDLEHIVLCAPAHLNPQGRILVEHGWNQGAAVRGFLIAAGFQTVATVRDIGGNERVSTGRLGESSALAR